MKCFGCGADIQVDEKVFRADTCSSCGRPLHACRNCVFYDPKAYHECRETQVEWVRDKDAANFCDYFRPAGSGSAAGGQVTQRSEDARRKLDDLFKK
jgi:hypothetical protein